MSAIKVRIHRLTWQWIAQIEDAVWPREGPLPASSKIQFLQMHNGIGKTTTLYLLRSLFTGIPPDPVTYARARYKGPKKEVGKSKFSVDLEIDGRPCILGLFLDTESCEHEFFTVVAGAGLESGWKPPHSFKKSFGNNPEFAELFLFDTQQAGAMTESLPAHVVDTAIREVARLAGVHDLITKGLDQIYESKIDQMGEGDGQRILTRTRNAIAKLEEIVKTRNGELDDTKKLVSKTQVDLTDAVKKKGELEAESALREKLETANERIAKARDQLATHTNALYHLYLEPSNLPPSVWSTVQEYYAKLDDLRIPELIASEVVDRLLEKGICICGEPLTQVHQKHLTAFKERMYGADVVQEIFSIKNSVKEATSGAGNVETVIEKARGAKEKLDIERGVYRRLRGRLTGDVEKRLKLLDKEIGDLRGVESGLKDAQKAIDCSDSSEIDANPQYTGKAFLATGELSQTASDYDSCRNLVVIRRGLRQLRQKEANVQGVARMRMAHELVEDTMRLAFDKVMRRMKDALLEEANLHLPQLQTTGMRIHSFDEGIELVDQQGVLQRGANTGGELSAQYSFLMALRKLGEIDVPIVLDNPTKGLDGTAANAFQTRLPSMFDQCLMLIYPLERAAIGDLVKRADHLATLHRADEEVSGLAPDGRAAVGPVVVNEDDSWFVNYDPPRAEV